MADVDTGESDVGDEGATRAGAARQVDLVVGASDQVQRILRVLSDSRLVLLVLWERCRLNEIRLAVEVDGRTRRESLDRPHRHAEYRRNRDSKTKRMCVRKLQSNSPLVVRRAISGPWTYAAIKQTQFASQVFGVSPFAPGFRRHCTLSP